MKTSPLYHFQIGITFIFCCYRMSHRSNRQNTIQSCQVCWSEVQVSLTALFRIPQSWNHGAGQVGSEVKPTSKPLNEHMTCIWFPWLQGCWPIFLPGSQGLSTCPHPVPSLAAPSPLNQQMVSWVILWGDCLQRADIRLVTLDNLPSAVDTMA